MNKFKHNDDGTTTLIIQTSATKGREKWRNPEGIFEILISTCHWGEVQKYRWNVIWNNNKHYVRGSINRKNVYLHRLLTNPPKGMDVDHINGDGMDNRDDNLRVCSRSQNNMNRGKDREGKSQFKGVRYDKRQAHTKPWGPFIQIHGKTHNGPRTVNEAEAATERDIYALRVLGHEGYINLNFPEKREQYLADIAAGNYNPWACER